MNHTHHAHPATPAARAKCRADVAAFTAKLDAMVDDRPAVDTADETRSFRVACEYRLCRSAVRDVEMVRGMGNEWYGTCVHCGHDLIVITSDNPATPGRDYVSPGTRTTHVETVPDGDFGW
jgi:hypothetical protein